MYIFFDTNTGQCIFFNLVLVLKKYTLTCINDKKINKKYTLTCMIVVFSSIVCEVNKIVFFFFYKTYFKTKIHKTITSN